MILNRLLCLALTAACLQVAACSPDDRPTVVVEGGACGDNYWPALDNYVASMDDDGDGVINSDEFNTAFQEAEDNDDGRLDITEMQNAVCSP